MAEKHTPVFIPVIREKQVNIDLNYFGIRQKMKKIGMNTFVSVKQTNQETGIELKKYYEDMNQCIIDFYEKIKGVINNGGKKES